MMKKKSCNKSGDEFGECRGVCVGDMVCVSSSKSYANLGERWWASSFSPIVSFVATIRRGCVPHNRHSPRRVASHTVAVLPSQAMSRALALVMLTGRSSPATLYHVLSELTISDLVYLLWEVAPEQKDTVCNLLRIHYPNDSVVHAITAVMAVVSYDPDK